MSRKKDKGRTPQFVMLLNDTLDSPAWRAMSLGARVLYAALKRQYWSNLHNNGRVWISHRTAQKKSADVTGPRFPGGSGSSNSIGSS